MSDVKSTPRISIVTPNLNKLNMLKQTVSSVLSNNYPNLEYIIVDGGSTDGSVEFIKSIEKKIAWWVSEPDNGMYDAVNKGLRRATGEIFGWLNPSDLYFPWTFKIVASVFSQFPELMWIKGLYSIWAGGGIRFIGLLRPYPRDFIRLGLHYPPDTDIGGFGFIAQESCFWRKELWDKAGPLRVDLKLAADFELWVRFSRFAELACVGTLFSNSIPHLDRRCVIYGEIYRNDVLKVINELPIKDQLLRKNILYKKDIVKYITKVFKLNKYIRKMLGLDKYKGPIVKWNIQKDCYQILYQHFF